MSYVAALHLYRIKLGTKLISLRPLYLGQGCGYYKGGGRRALGGGGFLPGAHTPSA